LLEVVNRSESNTSISWGGSFLSNPLSLDVEYQTVYSPFNPHAPFHQILLLSVRLQPFGSVILNGSSFVTPAGTVRYTTYGSTFLQRGGNRLDSSNHFKFSKFIVTGRVVDENDEPIAGAAFAIADQIVFSDSHGEFILPVKHRRTYLFTVD